MRRTFLYGLMTALLVVGATTAPRAQDGRQTLRAVLSGGSEAPTAVNTGAYGHATITLDRAAGEITWVIDVFNYPTGLTASHIHVGSPGTAGPIIIDFAPTVDRRLWAVPAEPARRAPSRRVPNAGRPIDGRSHGRHRLGQRLRQRPLAGQPRWRDPRPAVPGQGQRQRVQRHRALQPPSRSNRCDPRSRAGRDQLPTPNCQPPRHSQSPNAQPCWIRSRRAPQDWRLGIGGALEVGLS